MFLWHAPRNNFCARDQRSLVANLKHTCERLGPTPLWESLPRSAHSPKAPEPAAGLGRLERGADHRRSPKSPANLDLMQMRRSVRIAVPAKNEQPQLVGSGEQLLIRQLGWLGHAVIVAGLNPTVKANNDRPVSMQRLDAPRSALLGKPRLPCEDEITIRHHEGHPQSTEMGKNCPLVWALCCTCDGRLGSSRDCSRRA